MANIKFVKIPKKISNITWLSPFDFAPSTDREVLVVWKFPRERKLNVSEGFYDKALGHEYAWSISGVMGTPKPRIYLWMDKPLPPSKVSNKGIEA